MGCIRRQRPRFGKFGKRLKREGATHYRAWANRPWFFPLMFGIHDKKEPEEDPYRTALRARLWDCTFESMVQGGSKTIAVAMQCIPLGGIVISKAIEYTNDSCLFVSTTDAHVRVRHLRTLN